MRQIVTATIRRTRAASVRSPDRTLGLAAEACSQGGAIGRTALYSRAVLHRSPFSPLLPTLTLLLTPIVSCGDDGGEEATQPRCIELPAEPCNPDYTPTFDRIFDETLKRSCSQTNSCHNAEGRQGGLSFTDIAESHALLLGQVDGKARVVPNDAACSELIVRTHEVGKPWQMPPGTELRPGERCALRQWIQNGAPPAP